MWQPGQLNSTTMRNRIEAESASAGQRRPDRDLQGFAGACTTAYRPLPTALFQRSAAPALQGPAPLSFRRQNKKNQEPARSGGLTLVSAAGRLATIGGPGCPHREAQDSRARQSSPDGGILRDHCRRFGVAPCYGHRRPVVVEAFLLGGARAAVSRLQPACTGAQRQRLSDRGTGVRQVPVSVTRALCPMGGTFRGGGRA